MQLAPVGRPSASSPCSGAQHGVHLEAARGNQQLGLMASLSQLAKSWEPCMPQIPNWLMSIHAQPTRARPPPRGQALRLCWPCRVKPGCRCRQADGGDEGPVPAPPGSVVRRQDDSAGGHPVQLPCEQRHALLYELLRPGQCPSGALTSFAVAYGERSNNGDLASFGALFDGRPPEQSAWPRQG